MNDEADHFRRLYQQEKQAHALRVNELRELQVKYNRLDHDYQSLRRVFLGQRERRGLWNRICALFRVKGGWLDVTPQ